MSKGSKVCTFRLPSTLAEKVEGEIISHNYYSKNGPWTMTDFIIKAIEEKIAHSTRSRQKGRRKKPSVVLSKEELDSAIKAINARIGVIHPVAEKASEEKGMVIDDDRR